MYGNEPAIRAELDKLPVLAARTRVVHTDLTVAMSDKPSQALRRGKGTSLWLSIDAVRAGEADVAVSGGNTGAFMAMSRLILRPMAGIERPRHCSPLADREGRVHRARRWRQHRRHGHRAMRLRP